MVVSPFLRFPFSIDCCRLTFLGHGPVSLIGTPFFGSFRHDERLLILFCGLLLVAKGPSDSHLYSNNPRVSVDSRVALSTAPSLFSKLDNFFSPPLINDPIDNGHENSAPPWTPSFPLLLQPPSPLLGSLYGRNPPPPIVLTSNACQGFEFLRLFFFFFHTTRVRIGVTPPF